MALSTPAGLAFVHVTIEEIDAATSEDFWEQVAPALPAQDGGEVVVDLREVRFMDSTGLAMVVKLHRRLAGRGGHLRLENLQPPVARLLAISGVGELLERTDPTEP